LLHRDDLESNPASLRPVKSPLDLREVIRLDQEGNFRPLRAAPNLRRGWTYHVPNLASLQLALDYLYPAALANWMLWRHGQFPVTPWKETAERQTGRFHIVSKIDETALHDLVASRCQSGCLKQRFWPPVSQSAHADANEIPLLCPEACNFFVGKARTELKGADED
jgi:hypothetical protein